jgi:multidrug efflux pump subunit AcrA (membrane-fusion protein)
MNKRLMALELARAKEVLARRTVYSPASGIIHERLMSPGEFVHEQAPLVVIAEINPLYVEVFIPIALYGTVRKGMTTKVMPVEPVGGTYTATVTVVDKVFDAASGTFGVRLELPNPDFELPAGIKCTVDFGSR